MDPFLRNKYKDYCRFVQSGDVEGFGHMYEQIKSELAFSLFHWLNIYLAAESEDKTSATPTNKEGHCKNCCHHTKETSRSTGTNTDRMQHSAPDRSGSPVRPQFSSSSCSTPVSTGSARSSRRLGFEENGPNDPNMIATPYRAGQVWPDWNEVDVESPVYYDQVNDRLCVYRRGLFAYPHSPRAPVMETEQTVLTHPQATQRAIFSKDLRSIPEDRAIFSQNSLIAADFENAVVNNPPNFHLPGMQVSTHSLDHLEMMLETVPTATMYGSGNIPSAYAMAPPGVNPISGPTVDPGMGQFYPNQNLMNSYAMPTRWVSMPNMVVFG